MVLLTYDISVCVYIYTCTYSAVCILYVLHCVCTPTSVLDFFFADLRGDGVAFWGMVSCLFKNKNFLLG